MATDEFKFKLVEYGLPYALMVWEHAESRKVRETALHKVEQYQLHLTLEGFYVRMIIGAGAVMADDGEVWPEWEC
jgi:hypothetical protein